MKLIRSMIATGTLTLGLVGCAGLTPYPPGFLYDGSTVPNPTSRVEEGGSGKTGTKTGESCVSNILGLISLGDGSIAAAKQAGGVSAVHAAKLKRFSVLGLYTSHCTVVMGD